MQTKLWFVAVCFYFNGGICGEEREAIGRGSFGLVLVARNGHGEKVVIKKLLSKDNREKCLFLKEAKILHAKTVDISSSLKLHAWNHVQ